MGVWYRTTDPIVNAKQGTTALRNDRRAIGISANLTTGNSEEEDL
jgi:hypothetical protein